MSNTAEDTDIHAVRWPKRAMSHLTRDACAVALQDVRSIAHAARAGKLEPGTCDRKDWNNAIAVLIRSLAMVRGAYRCASATAGCRHTAAATKAANRATAAVDSAFGPHLLKIITDDILRRIERDNGVSHRKACESISALMRFSDDLPEEQVGRDGEEPSEEEEEPGGTEKKKSRNPMRIQLLPLEDDTDPSLSSRGRSRRGTRIIGARLARAVVNQSTVGLFLKPRKNDGGAVCIDASGSMSFSQASLEAVCMAAPAATVGYYAGHNAAPGVYGTLRIFARGRKRARACPRIGGSNDVDLWAVRWLLAQSGPRVLVSDLEFCGGPAGQDAAAHAEVDRAVRNGSLVVAANVEEALAIFKALKT